MVSQTSAVCNKGREEYYGIKNNTRQFPQKDVNRLFIVNAKSLFVLAFTLKAYPLADMQRENAAAKRHLHYAFSAHAPQAIVNPLSFMVVYKRCTCGFTIIHCTVMRIISYV